MKKLVMAAMLGLLLFGTNAPTEASTVESAIGSQVEVVEVMRRPMPHHHRDDWRDHDRRQRDDWRNVPDRQRNPWRHHDPRRDRHPHCPNFPMPRR